VLQGNGQLLEFGGGHEITLRRPDRLRIQVARRDGQSKVLYFDGSAISIDLPGHGAFVREERPGTAYAALDYLVEELGVPAPLEDLISENFASGVKDRIGSGFYVGPAELTGRTCEHLAFRLPEVDVQLWVEAGARPLICRIVITHKSFEGNPQFRATLHDWDLTPETPETLFHFEPEEGSERLVVGSIDARAMRRGEEIE
jgi:hypothetical protein